MHRDRSDFLQLYMHLRVCIIEYIYVSLSTNIMVSTATVKLLVYSFLLLRSSRKKISFLNLLSSHTNFGVSLSVLMLILDRILIGNASCLW